MDGTRGRAGLVVYGGKSAGARAPRKNALGTKAPGGHDGRVLRGIRA